MYLNFLANYMSTYSQISFINTTVLLTIPVVIALTLSMLNKTLKKILILLVSIYLVLTIVNMYYQEKIVKIHSVYQSKTIEETIVEVNCPIVEFF